MNEESEVDIDFALLVRSFFYHVDGLPQLGVPVVSDKAEQSRTELRQPRRSRSLRLTPVAAGRPGRSDASRGGTESSGAARARSASGPAAASCKGTVACVPRGILHEILYHPDGFPLRRPDPSEPALL